MNVKKANTIRFPALTWLAAVVCHNLEEAIWLPEWSQTAGDWYAPVAANEFRIAALMLTLLLTTLVTLSARQSKAPNWAHWLLGGCALAMALNFIGPHLAATLAFSHYMPGLATSALLVVPTSIWLLAALFTAKLISWPRFAWIGALTVAAMVAVIPLLFWVARNLAN